MDKRIVKTSTDCNCSNPQILPQLLSLPVEIIFRILCNLPKKKLFWNVGLTCQKLFAVCCDILDSQIELPSNISSEIFYLRLKQLVQYQEIKCTLRHVIIDSPGFYTLDDGLKRIKDYKDVQPGLSIICHKKLSRKNAIKVCDMLKRCNYLKGLFLHGRALERTEQSNEDVSQSSSSSENNLDLLSACGAKLELISLIGCNENVVFLRDKIMANSLTLKYLNLSHSLVNSDSTLLEIIRNCVNLHQLVLYGVALSDESRKEILNVVKLLNNGLVSPYWLKRAVRLKDQFCKHGTCGEGMTEQEIMGKYNGDGLLHMPEPLLALLMAAREWHSIR